MPSLISAPQGARRTLTAWWCHCGKRNDGHNAECTACASRLRERHAQVHVSERAVYFRHPVTGQIIRPARADQPMHENYQSQGFIREEVLSMLQHERDTGSVHEASNFSSGNEPSPVNHPDKVNAPKELINTLIDDLRSANQSGSWTMDKPLADGSEE